MGGKQEQEHEGFYDEDSCDTSMTAAEGNPLLFTEQPRFKTQSRRCGTVWKRTVFALTFTAFNVLLFLTALGIWGQAILLLRTKASSCQVQNQPAPACVDTEEEDLKWNSRVTFQPVWPLVEEPTNNTNEIWERFSPPGEGVIELANEATHGLPPSRASDRRPDTHKVYGISVFHQMHCVNLLRMNFYPETLKKTFPNQTEEMNLKHRNHCIDYLRQTIMCHADPTFEPWTKDGINGMGAIHQCRDYEKIWTWAYEQRYERDKDIF